MGFEEKRDSPRLQTQLQLNLVYNDFQDLVAETENISEGGIYVKTNSPLPLGTEVRLKISLVHVDIAYVQAEGVVIHINKPDDSGADKEMSPGMGIKFTSLDPKSAKFIKEYIRKRENA